jgi:hypothetical protein
VFFPDEPKVGVKTIKMLAERMRNEGVQRAVMVTQANMTPFAKQCLSEMAPKYYIELFQEAELLVNITKHALVPQHRILTREEKQTLLDRYKVGGTTGQARIPAGQLLVACRPSYSLQLDVCCCRWVLGSSDVPTLAGLVRGTTACPCWSAGQGYAAAPHPV